MLHDFYPLDLTRHLSFTDSPARGGFEIRGGKAVLAGGPGLGVTLDDGLVDAMAG